MIMALFLGSAFVLPPQGRAGPLDESFEGTTFPPDGWDMGPGTTDWARTSGSAHTGSYKARARGQNAWLFTPLLTAATGDTLKFWYRSESASYATSFYVRLSTSATQADTFGYTTVLADYQNITSTTYLEGKIDLSSYKGDVYIAFHRYYGQSTYWYLYLDDVYFPAIWVPANDMATISIDNPSDGAGLEGNSSVSVQATVKNVGSTTQSSVPVNLEITDGATYTYTDVEYTGTLNQDDTEQITFSPDWTVPNTVAGYTIKVWTALTKADEDPSNDTLSISVTGYPEGYTIEGFESTTFPPEDWTKVHTAGSGWFRTTSYPHSGVASARCAYTSGSHWLITPKLEVTAKGDKSGISAKGDELRYWIRRYYSGYDDDWFFVEVSTGGSDTSAFVAVDSFHTDALTYDYVEKTVDLSGYALEGGKGLIYVAFHYQATGGPYVHVDDVLLPPIYVPAGDMSTVSIDDVPGAVETGTSTTIKATVQNLGAQTANAGVPVKLRIEGPLGYVYTDNDEVTSLNLDPTDTEQITFTPDWVAPDTLCSYTIKVWTELGGDGMPENDTLSQQVSVYRFGGLVESFTETTFPPPGWTVYNFDASSPWARYTSYYHSAPACCRVYYDLPNNDWLITPRLKGQDGDKLKFWWRVQSSSYEETLLVRVSTNPDVSDTGAYAVVHTIMSNSTEWSEEVVDLSAYDGQDIYIAWYYDCYNNYGFAVDDITAPYYPTQIAVSPDSVYEESFPDSFFDVYMYIGNVAGGELIYSIELETAVGWLSVDPTSGSALGGEEDTITLSFNTTGLDGHYYNTVKVISNSGEKQDEDTVLVPVHLYVRLIPEISVSPDSFAVGVEGNSTKDTSMFISNSGTGDLDYTIETEEWEGKAVYTGEPATRPHKVDVEEWADCERKGAEDTREGIPPSKGTGGPDAFGYRWFDSDEPGGPIYSWVEINAVGTELVLGDDDNEGPFPIGFTFDFYGNEFDSFYICSNGFISFTSTLTTLTNDTIPDPTGPENLLALFWDDLKPVGGSGGIGYIYYHNDGSKLIIEYDGVMRYACDTCLYTMEAILYPSGKIIYQYKTMTGHRLDEATIGIENEDGTDGLEVVFNAEYMHDELAIKFSSAPSWLVFSPEFGTVPPSETDTIEVTFDATGILTGEFYGAFIISSNAPDKGLDTIPAHMSILVPDMSLSPDSIATTCNEGDGVQHQTMNVGNAGEASLIFNIVEGAPWLSIAPDADTVNPGDPDAAIDLAIDCTDLYAGKYMAELKIYSNDPNFQPYAIYKVYLQVGPDPDIDVEPDSFYAGVYAGYTKDTTMTIENTGDGHLVYGINIEETGKVTPDTVLSEGFEGDWPPEDWLVVNNDGGTQEWGQYSTYSHTGSYSACSRWESSTLRNDDWLITPQLTVGSNDTLTFWYRVYLASYPESLEVRMSTTTSDLSNFTTVLWAEDGLTNTSWLEKKIELSKHGKGQVYIAFVNKGLNQWRIMVDDVVVESFAGPWLAVNPMYGIIDPLSSQAVSVTFNATAVVEADKYADLWIVSNDPDENPVKVPVHMAVLGPNYSVNPESLHIDAVEDAYTDGHIFMQNYGGHAPLAYKMTTPAAWLSMSPDTIDVPMDTEQDVTVTVDGFQLIAGDYLTYIIIKTNDFDVPEDTVPVSVHVGPDPDIQVRPDSYFVQMSAGSIKDTTLTVVNPGEGTLAFEVSTEETEPPFAAAPSRLSESEVYEILKANEAYRTRMQANPMIAFGREYQKTTEPMTADEIMAKRRAARQGAGAGFPKNGAIKACVVDSWGNEVPDCWDYLNANWSSFGSDEIVIDYSYLDFDYIDYHDLVTSEADVLIISNAWRINASLNVDWHFTDAETTAIHQYMREGAGLIMTSGTFNSGPYTEISDNGPRLAPMVGLDPATYYQWPDASDVYSMNLLDPGHPVLAGVPDPYAIQYPSTCTPLSEDWHTAIVDGEIIALSTDNIAAIIVYSDGPSNRVYISTAAEYMSVTADYQFVYNSILWGAAGVQWLIVSPEADTVAPGDSVDLDVTFDATELGEEDKYGNIILSHNAPDKGTTIVPVHLTFFGPNYSVDPIQLTIGVNEGEYSQDYLDVQNFGGTGVLSYKMTPSDPWLTADPDTEDVAEEGYQTVTVTVDGTTLIYGDIEGYILVTTNDMSHAKDSIPVFVHVEPPPDIDAPTKVVIGVIPGCENVRNLRVSNLGEGHLGFATSIAQTAPLGKQADVLLVDDDNSAVYPDAFADARGYFTDALTANGYTYDIFEVTVEGADGPDASTMASYPVVIWFTGEAWRYNQTLTPNDETNLATYLDGGGNLFLSSHDYFYDRYISVDPGYFSSGQFPYDYLGVTWTDQDVWWLTDPQTGTVAGMPGSVAEGMTFNLFDIYTEKDGLCIDEIQHMGTDLFQVTDPSPTGICACQYEVEGKGFKVVFTTVDFAGLVDGVSPSTRAELMAAIMDWFLGVACPFTVTPEADTLDPESFEDLVLTFDGEAFEECVEETMTCYLLINSNDPDEPQKMVEVEMWSGRGDVLGPEIQPCLLDLGDVLFLINFVLKEGPAPDPLCMGDCNPPHDDIVDIEDVLYLIQHLWGGGMPPAVAPKTEQPPTTKQPLRPTPLERK